MSWAATAYVKKLKRAPNGEKITKGEKLVLFVLADYHNEERGDAWASLSHLAEEALASRYGVIQAIKSLERKGILQVIRLQNSTKDRLTNRYRFTTIDGMASQVSCLPPSQVSCLPPSQVSCPGASQLSSPYLSKETLPEESFQEREADSTPVVVSKIGRRPQKRLVPWPETFTCTDALQTWATAHGCRDPAAEFERFHAKATAKAWVYADWAAAFRNWVLGELKYAAERQGRGADRVSPVRHTTCAWVWNGEDFRQHRCGAPITPHQHGPPRPFCATHLKDREALDARLAGGGRRYATTDDGTGRTGRDAAGQDGAAAGAAAQPRSGTGGVGGHSARSALPVAGGGAPHGG